MSDIVWDRDAAAHLLRRAGLPGPPGEIDELHAFGLEGAVEWLLDFEAVDDGALEARLASLDLDLDDGNPCTADTCVGNACQSVAISGCKRL